MASNISIVGDATLNSKNTSAGFNNPSNYVFINFSVAWENSWRTNNSAPYNYDAAWIFAKYRIGNGEWKHITISQTENQSETNTEILGTSDGKGVFIYNSQDFSGNFTSNNNKLKWYYVNDGVNDNDDIEVKIYAIEMVYIPQGQFYVGTPGFEIGTFYKYPEGANDQFLITSEGAITVGTSAGNLHYNSNYDGWHNGNSGDRNGPIPTAFPKGYNSSFVMKYEVTQEQYVDFLNLLTRNQQNYHTSTDISGTFPKAYRPYVMSKTRVPAFRNGIRCADNFSISDPIEFYCDLNSNNIPNETNDGQNIACNFLSWADAAAYTAWAGLRPMTELEYEKTCRGSNQSPLNWESAWAVDEGLQPNAHQATGISNPGAPDEKAANSDARANYFSTRIIGYNTGVNIGGPMRVGCFATTSSNRQDAGASYYGVMNLSGNLRERVITVGVPKGRSYTGTNGNGTLSSKGLHTNTDWPDEYAEGSGGKGADWAAGIHHNSSVSYRYHVATPNYTRSGNNGMRACRTVN